MEKETRRDGSLASLVETIKTDAIEAGKAEVARMIAEATAQASSITQTARTEADTIREGARKEAEEMMKTAQVAINAAARKVIVSLIEQITNILRETFRQDIAAAFNGQEFVSNLISKLVEHWAVSGKLMVAVSTAELRRYLGSVWDRAASPLELKVNPRVGEGFRVKRDSDGGFSYEVSPSVVEEALCAFIPDALATMIGGNHAVHGSPVAAPDIRNGSVPLPREVHGGTGTLAPANGAEAG
jgi:vacuolar-type H+-ATPase subunit E/Vma4